MYSTEEGAHRYQQTLVPLMFAPLARRLVAGAALAPDARVLDIATGTGVVARAAALAAPHGRTTAFDANPYMLAVARRTPAVPDAAQVEYLLSTVEDASLPAAAFDTGFCQQGLQFFEDPVGALDHVRRALRPDGALHVALWGREQDNPFTSAVQNALRALGLDEFTGFLDRVHHLHEPAPVIELLRRAGFHVERHIVVTVMPDEALRPRDAARLLAATPLAAKLETLGDEQNAALTKALEQEMSRAAGDGDAIEWEILANLYTARLA